jgi:hypothetical protein
VKKTYILKATLRLNHSKGGGWLASYSIMGDGTETQTGIVSAWKNASAAKRWLKEEVVKSTPRKSIKMTATGAVDAKGKPSEFVGELTYRGDK